MQLVALDQDGRMDSTAAQHGWRTPVPGLAIAAVAVLCSLGFHAVIPALPAMTVAVLLGILAANMHLTSGWVTGSLRAGLDFAGKHLMRVGIVFLGLKLSFGQLAALGWRTVGLVVAVVLVSFVGTYYLGKLFRLPAPAPLLVATGFAICGASAIGAMSAVKGIKSRDTVLPIALVTLCGTLAIGVLPLLALPLQLTPLMFGQWVGASVHDVGQVVATAQSAGPAALAAAVVIKLTRVVLLAPMVTVAGLVERRSSRKAGTSATSLRLPPLVPLFVVGFLAMAALRSTGWLPAAAIDLGSTLQDIALGAALFGLGSAISVRELLGAGAKASLMALAAWALIAALGLLAVQLM